MFHILYIMLNFDEVYISDIPSAVSIATWYIYTYASSDLTATLHDYLPNALRAKALGNYLPPLPSPPLPSPPLPSPPLPSPSSPTPVWWLQ